jgi:hypothetical protein
MAGPSEENVFRRGDPPGAAIGALLVEPFALALHRVPRYGVGSSTFYNRAAPAAAPGTGFAFAVT